MKKTLITLGLIISSLIIAGCTTTPEIPTPTNVTIIIPADIETYKTAMTEYSQVGGEINPAETTEFITQEIASSSEDKIKASAIISAQIIKDDATIEYFEIKENTAYLLLNLHLDGYAGVSTHLAQIEPVITLTLLNWTGIDNVVFDYAP